MVSNLIIIPFGLKGKKISISRDITEAGRGQTRREDRRVGRLSLLILKESSERVNCHVLLPIASGREVSVVCVHF